MKLNEYKGLNYAYGLLLILGIWQIIGMITHTPLFPTPVDICTNILKTHSEIGIHLVYSLIRILFGIFLTLIIGVPLGIILGYFKKSDLLFSPILYFSYPVPKMALLPIIMLLFGLGELTKIMMIFLITFFPVVVNIRDEIKNIPKEVYYPMYSLGASTLAIIKEIILPGIIPAILSSLRIGIGTAISVLFFTENFGTEYGMGYFIMDSWMRINYIQMYSGIMILSSIGLLIFLAIDLLESIICPWR